MIDVEAVATKVIDCGFKLHRRLGPGLLETVYEAFLAEGIKRRGLSFAPSRLRVNQITAFQATDFQK